MPARLGTGVGVAAKRAMEQRTPRPRTAIAAALGTLVRAAQQRRQLHNELRSRGARLGLARPAGSGQRPAAGGGGGVRTGFSTRVWGV